MMTEEEIAQLEQGYSESKIQHTCVSWFRQTFPSVANLLFAVPNGGWRGAKAGAMMQYEGQVAGVADLILLYPCGGKASLCIEMKVPKKKGSSAGRQSEQQKAWQALAENHGSVYVVCRGLMEFSREVCKYLRIDEAARLEIERKILNQYAIFR